MESLAQRIAREVGKALWDARGEARLLAPKVDVTLDDGMGFTAPSTAARARRPAINPAACWRCSGPSTSPRTCPTATSCPRSPPATRSYSSRASTRRWSESGWAALWREAGLPEGVLQVRARPRRDRRRAGAAPGRGWRALHRLLVRGRDAARGHRRPPRRSCWPSRWAARTPSSVCADADLDLAVAETALSICRQHGPALLAARAASSWHGRIFDEFAKKAGRRARGYPRRPAARRGRLHGTAHGLAEAARACTALPRTGRGGRRPKRIDAPRADLPAPYLGPGLVRFDSTRARTTPTTARRSSAPRPASTRWPTSTKPIAAVNDSDYGLVASVMTRRNRSAFEHCVGRVRTGLLNWNRATVGASGRLPFGGRAQRQRPTRRRDRDALLHRAPGACWKGPGRFDPDSPCRRGCPGRELRMRTVLMGDPEHFSVQGGANPHTRTRWGTRRTSTAPGRSRSGSACATPSSTWACACWWCRRTPRSRGSSIPPTPAS